MNTTEHRAVFLSYASQDAEAAKRICEALRAAGVEVWFDQSELVGGDAWDAKIRKQIKDCALLIPIISANTQARTEGYFRLEWRLADQRTHLMGRNKAFLLPVTIDSTTDAEADVPDSFSAVQWTRLKGGETPPAFCERVKALLDAGGGSPRGSCGDVDRGALPSSDDSGVHKGSLRRKRTWPFLLLTAVAVSAALIAFSLWPTGRSPHPISPQSDAVEVTKESTEISALSQRTTLPSVAALLTRARTLVAKTDAVRSDLDTAASLLEQAAKQEPTSAIVWAERSLVDWRYLAEYLDRSMARLDSARRHAAQAIGIEPENPLARLAHAAAMTAVQRDPATKQRAIQLLEPIVERITDRADGLYLLASLQSTDAALEAIGRAARMPGEAGRAHLNRANTFIRAGRMREADEAVDHALTAERSIKALLAKSYYLTIWHGDTTESQRLHAEVPPEVWSEDFAASARYFVELCAGKPDRALAAMSAVPREFIESYALSGPTAYYRGYALARAYKPAAAETEWRTALAVVQRELASRPNDQTLLTFSALLHWNLGDRPAALKVWQSLRELTGGRLISWENFFLQMTILPDEEAIAKLESLPPSDMLCLAANLRLNPFLDRFRNHPRFVALQAKRDADPRSSPRAAGSPQSDAKSVAVLAFANLSDDKSNEYFSDGISEELLNVLAKVPGLKVSARTSAFHFKGKDTPIPEIAQQLGVAYVVEGSVRKQGDKVRITAQLIKAADGFHVWSDTFTRDLKDIFAVQDEIAGLIAKALALRLGVGSSSTTAAVNPEALRLYLEGRQLWNLRTSEGLARADGLFRRALELEPNFARALSGLADVGTIRRSGTGGRLAQREEVVAQAERAIALDPTLAEPHATLGLLAFFSDWDFDAAERHFQQAVARNPSYAWAHLWWGQSLMTQGRVEEAMAENQRAIEADPLAPRIASNTALLLLLAGRPADALASADRSLSLLPGEPQAQTWKTEALLMLGREAEALKIVREALAIDPQRRDFTYVLARAGTSEERAAAMAAPDPRFANPTRSLLAIGRVDDALAGLEADARDSVFAFQFVLFHPAFDEVRKDPRFVKMLESLRMTEAHTRAQAWRAEHRPQKELVK